MKRTRVAPVKGTRNARTSLAFLLPCIGQLRAVYFGPLYLMKQERSPEGEALVAQSEKTLRDVLIEVLAEDLDKGAVLFMNSRFFPKLKAKGLTDKLAEALLDGASTAVDLRKSLGLPVVGSVGKLYLDACEELSRSEHLLNDPEPLVAALLG